MPYFNLLALCGEADELEGPTIFGDKDTTKKIIKSLKGLPAKDDKILMGREPPVQYQHAYATELSPRQVLDKMEHQGYQLVCVANNEDFTMWTMHLPLEIVPKRENKKAASKSKATGIVKGMKRMTVNGGEQDKGHESSSGSGSDDQSHDSGSGSEEDRKPEPKGKSAVKKSVKK